MTCWDGDSQSQSNNNPFAKTGGIWRKLGQFGPSKNL